MLLYLVVLSRKGQRVKGTLRECYVLVLGGIIGLSRGSEFFSRVFEALVRLKRTSTNAFERFQVATLVFIGLVRPSTAS